VGIIAVTLLLFGRRLREAGVEAAEALRRCGGSGCAFRVRGGSEDRKGVDDGILSWWIWTIRLLLLDSGDLLAIGTLQ
jgi:hypothetical protein